MKYRNWIIVLVIIGIFLGVGVYFIFYSLGKNQNQDSNYQAERTKADVSLNNTIEEEKKEEEKNKENKEVEKQELETEIASFSTKILTKDNSRQKNISITCNTLNDTIVEPGSTFSFCNIVGQATTNKGYEKADIFDAKRKCEERTWWR